MPFIPSHGGGGVFLPGGPRPEDPAITRQREQDYTNRMGIRSDVLREKDIANTKQYEAGQDAWDLQQGYYPGGQPLPIQPQYPSLIDIIRGMIWGNYPGLIGNPTNMPLGPQQPPITPPPQEPVQPQRWAPISQAVPRAGPIGLMQILSMLGGHLGPTQQQFQQQYPQQQQQFRA